MSFFNQTVVGCFVLLLLMGHSLSSQTQSFGQRLGFDNGRPCISQEHRARIQALIKEKIETLHLPESSENDPLLLELPVRQASNFNDRGYMSIWAYVDHDLEKPGELLDYNCGERTYDRQESNHGGTDYVSWPFSWHKMKHDQVEIVAAAPGTIVYKNDGLNDLSCSFDINAESWNAVYVRHDDGTVALYGHMKRNSLTTKKEGDRVETGEFLGLVGSSGISTRPHLHFELLDADGKEIDPFFGDCNSTTDRSWWKEQAPYREPFISKLMTHSAPPVLFACSEEEQLNHKVNFTPGETGYFVTYFHDQQSFNPTTHQLISPSGQVARQWIAEINGDRMSITWTQDFQFPEDSELGKWTFRATEYDQVYEEYFYLVPESGADLGVSLSTDEVVIENIQIGYRGEGQLTITNTGNSGLMVEEIQHPNFFSGGWYGLIHAGESKDIHVYFQPEQEGEFTGQMNIKTNHGDYQVNLRGTTNCSAYEGETTIGICQGTSFEFGDRVLTDPGNYTGTFQGVDGCDSTVNLTLNFIELDLTLIETEGSITVAELGFGARFQWFDCATNTMIAGADSRTFTPGEVGQYSVLVTRDDCQQMSDCVMVDVVLGVEHNEISDQLQVYPNPTQGKVTVDFGDVSVNGSYQLLDNTGLRVNSGELTNQKLLELQLNLPAGIYFLQITDRQGRRSVINVVKQ